MTRSLFACWLSFGLMGCGAGASPEVDSGGSAAPLGACNPPGSRVLKVYVSGESIEERNRFVENPFRCDGNLNERGGGNFLNDNDEYGWMVPLAGRLALRDPALAVEFVGSSAWTSADDAPYSGSFPATAGRTSAIAGTDISDWLEIGSPERKVPARRRELEGRQICYQVAFAAHGGNDLNHDVSDDDYKGLLKDLLKLLVHGSSCTDLPLVYVVTHLPDRGDVATMDRAFRTRTLAAVAEFRSDPALPAAARDRIHTLDVYQAFKDNQPTTAFPTPGWFGGGHFDSAAIGRDGDGAHPRRLASIYAGEVAADGMALEALRALVP